MICALPVMAVTPAGYLFFAIIILSYGLAYLWLSRKKKATYLYVGLAGAAITFALMMPAMISIQIFENGNQTIRIGLIAGWLLIIAVIIAINRSKRVNLGWSALVYVFFAIGGVLFLVLVAGMGYFVYLRMFTHERDDAPMWAVFLCIFFLAVLILVLFGQLFKGKGNKDGKTEFDDLNEALLTPDVVFGLNLSGKGLTALPADVLKFANLTNLDLSNNQISDLPADIVKLKYLSTIKLSNNPISDQGRTMIRKMFPPETELVFRT